MKTKRFAWTVVGTALFIVAAVRGFAASPPVGRAVRAETPLPPERLAAALGERPDFTASGDFDADGREDLVAAARGGRALWLLAGDGAGSFAAPTRLDLPGRVTALAAADVNRADGLPDLLVGVSEGDRASLLLYESRRGAALAVPLSIDLPAPAAAFAAGQLGGDYPIDVAVAAGKDLLVLLGEDRRLGRGGAPAPWHPAIARVSLPSEVVSLSRSASAGSGSLRGGLSVVTSGGRRFVVSLTTAHTTELVVSEAGADARDGARAPSVNLDGAKAPSMTLDGARASSITMSSGLAPSAVFTVNSAADTDDGACDPADCTLREAILAANAMAGPDAIGFALGDGTPLIGLASPLPAITDAVTIDGETGGARRIEIGGSEAGAGANGLALAAGSGGSVVRALVINGFDGSGVRIETTGNAVEDCFIGTDAAGTKDAKPNLEGGILLTGPDATLNRIGGASAAARNVISNNGGHGVRMDGGASENVVAGNFIGVDAAGSDALANMGDGVSLGEGARDNVVGGTVTKVGAAPGNVISGNRGRGVGIGGSATDGNRVAGNMIGTDASGASARSNLDDGVRIESGARGNTIGGTSNALRNVIAASGSDGVEITGSGTDQNHVFGNFIGTDASGLTALGNAGYGVLVADFAGDCLIGSATTTPGRTGGNVISGNALDGARLADGGALPSTIQGNLIGLTRAGDAALPNGGSGVALYHVGTCDVGGEAVENRNVISGSSLDGVTLQDGSWRNRVKGNFIGVDATGARAVPNGRDGVSVTAAGFTGSSYNEIGGETEEYGTPPGNVISGNARNGVHLGGGATDVYGNLIGLDATGEYAVGNGEDGVKILGGANYVGDEPEEGNVISGNGSDGVEIGSTFAYLNYGADNHVLGNRIGTNKEGTAAIPNMGNGVLLLARASSNFIGGYYGYDEPNLISGNHASPDSDGIEVNGAAATNNWIESNWIGLSADGVTPLPNGGNGILITNGASGNIIGFNHPGSGNVISGNDLSPASDGIEINGSSSNRLQGNRIGTDVTGLIAVGNGGDGLLITALQPGQMASSNLVGDASNRFSRNLFSANHGHGIRIQGGGAVNNVIATSIIGLGIDGSPGLGNLGHGIYVRAASKQNTIGGTSGVTPGACTGACNRIGSNALAGVAIDSTAATSNAVRGNSIAGNGGLGIDLLQPSGPTPNDPLDTDFGPNRLQNYPLIVSASPGESTTTIEGTVDSAANASYAIELFGSEGTSISGTGEGQVLLGTAVCSTDGTGHGTWSITIAGSSPYYSATATDPTSNTSEISPAFAPDSDRSTPRILTGPARRATTR